MNLNSLNSVYKDDCLKLRESRESVIQSERQVAFYDNAIIIAEQKIKKMERRWMEGIASVDELDQLRQIRLELTRLTMERLGQRSGLLACRKNLELLNSTTEALWVDFMAKNTTKKSNNHEKLNHTTKSKRKLNAQGTFSKANKSTTSQSLQSITKFKNEDDLKESVYGDTLESFSSANHSSQELTLPSPQRLYSPANVLARVKALEREVYALSNIGSSTLSEFESVVSRQYMRTRRASPPPDIITKNREDIMIDDNRVDSDTDIHQPTRVSLHQQEEGEQIPFEVLYQTQIQNLSYQITYQIISDAYRHVFEDKVLQLTKQHEEEKVHEIGLLSCHIADDIISECTKELLLFTLNQYRMDLANESMLELVSSTIEELLLESMIEVSCADRNTIIFYDRLIAGRKIIAKVVSKYLTRKKLRHARDFDDKANSVAAAQHRSRQLMIAFSTLLLQSRLAIVSRSVQLRYTTRYVLAKAMKEWYLLFTSIRVKRLKEEAINQQIMDKEEEELYIHSCAATCMQRHYRGFVARRLYQYQLRSINIINLQFRKYISKIRMRQRLLYVRCIHEYTIAVDATHISNCLKLAVKAWTMTHHRLRALRKLYLLVANRTCRRKFARWKATAGRLQVIFLREQAAAIRIQCLIRLFLVKKKILNFFKWRKCLVKAQALSRAWLQQRRFQYYVMLQQNAIKLQKYIRGMQTRKKFEEDRIESVHIAAIGNNYDRFTYLLRIFPHLIYSVNKAGNQLMHSAAIGASKRVFKFLLRLELDPNIYNKEGYAPIHLLIQSSAVYRDACFDYMLEHGCNEELFAIGHVSCILLAVTYGRTYIVNKLLVDYGANSNIPDEQGNTCLQVACSYGYSVIVDHLLESHANPNQPGALGYYPLHYCIAVPERVKLCNKLLAYKANPNVYNEFNDEYPLMTACAQGVEDMVELLLLQNANPNIVDKSGWTVVHYAASKVPGNLNVYKLLLAADVNFEYKDVDGNTPIHICAMYNNVQFMKYLLEGGVQVAVQNNEGDFPSHIAAQYNFIDCLQIICQYEKDMGRINYKGQTPIGCANFHGSTKASEFLLNLYDKINPESVDVLSLMDSSISQWVAESDSQGDRVFIHQSTKERRNTPPALSSDSLTAKTNLIAGYRKKNIITIERHTITKNEYLREVKATKHDIQSMMQEISAAALIAKRFRKLVAYKRQQRFAQQLKWRRIIFRFMTRLPKFVRLVRAKRLKRIIAIQSLFRGYYFRKQFYSKPIGIYERLWWESKRRKLAVMLYRMWNRYKLVRLIIQMKYMRFIPNTYDEWVISAKQSSLIRTHGVYEEFRFVNVYFYRNILTGTCTFNKPTEWRLLDMQTRIEKDHLYLGYTKNQIGLIIKLQAIVRGRKARTYHIRLEKAIAIAESSLEIYLKHPDVDENVYNYALYCHVVLNDNQRARSIYMDALRRMTTHGPDIPLVLYSYAIFTFVTHEADYSDVRVYATRARNAELNAEVLKRSKLDKAAQMSDIVKTFRYGKSYDVANMGFFQHYSDMYNTSISWHQYAACQFIVYNDFEESFTSFVRAFELDANNRLLKANFDTMMTHYFGTGVEAQKLKTEYMQNYMRTKTKPRIRRL